MANSKRYIVKVNDKVICQRMKKAKSAYARMKGLMFTSSFNEDDFDGLMLEPCNSIHSFFMKMQFHAVFLDKQNSIVKILKSMKPWRFSRMYLKANKVLELPDSTNIDYLNKGDQLEVICIN